ncbi:MAG: hypothetical protein GF307_11590 [candidate division Zixibacteria bacterium]|nr:hypothetical protein [candidate division Zixibacteria bacterium]
MDSKYLVVEFKGYRRNVYYNYLDIPLKPGEYAIVQAERGEDLGKIVRTASQFEIEKSAENPLNLLRVAGTDDMDRLRVNRQKEEESFYECLSLIEKHGLKMKLVDVEFQYDCNKITFFFTAEKRVDFRELVKDLANIYKTRIELRQIGVRDEAKRLGGFGCCGLQQCCSSWLPEFSPVSTQHARDQSLSLNPSKISGNCGRLLCCLLYEHPVYEEITRKFPKPGEPCEVCRDVSVIDRVNLFREYVVARYEDGAEEKIPLLEYRKRLKRLRNGSKTETKK